MRWRDVESRGVVYSLQHLHPFTTTVQVGHRAIDLVVKFGFHVFTDEKGNGRPLVHDKERRFFCPKRCADSHQAVGFFQQANISDVHVRPYIAKSKNQQFFLMDGPDYAMFLAIQKPANTTNRLNCRVVSAYTVDSWGRGNLPTWARMRTMGFVLDRREQGEPIRM